ncbi:hypothetical protein BC941DRAFT_432400 [Chlamydoabsidia padenii]|nr:hypothetical protein BC941DRAFT_432400 [Chlamydoabsidia padenii]
MENIIKHHGRPFLSVYQGIHQRMIKKRHQRFINFLPCGFHTTDRQPFDRQQRMLVSGIQRLGRVHRRARIKRNSIQHGGIHQVTIGKGDIQPSTIDDTHAENICLEWVEVAEFLECLIRADGDSLEVDKDGVFMLFGNEPFFGGHIALFFQSFFFDICFVNAKAGDQVLTDTDHLTYFVDKTNNYYCPT